MPITPTTPANKGLPQLDNYFQLTEAAGLMVRLNSGGGNMTKKELVAALGGNNPTGALS